MNKARPSTIAVKLYPKSEKWVRQCHPWIFDEGIESASSGAKTGDIAVVFDRKKNSFLACGFWDAESPIRIKLCQFGKPAKLNKDWFANKLKEAFELRESLLANETTGYRLLYGENDQFPGLICDVYDKVAVLKLYSGIWWVHLLDIVELLNDLISPDAIVLRTARNVKSPDGFEDGVILRGELKNEEVVFEEFGLKFISHVLKGHKTGYFLDHRSNRKRVGEISGGKRVLDVFAYAGGFSVHALAGGASEVTSVDISEQALELSKKNAALNNFSGKHTTICGDAFKVLQDLIDQGAEYDIVVIDPPSFAKRATEIPGAITAYTRLIRLGYRLVAKGGTFVMASCSSRIQEEEFFDLVNAELQKSGRSFKLESRWGHDIDHPISFSEGRYLKCGFYRLD